MESERANITPQALEAAEIEHTIAVRKTHHQCVASESGKSAIAPTNRLRLSYAFGE